MRRLVGGGPPGIVITDGEAIDTDAFALQALSNGYFLFFLALPVAVVALYELARRRGQWTTLLPQLAAAVVVILAILAPFAAMYLQLRREGYHRSPSEWINFSATGVPNACHCAAAS